MNKPTTRLVPIDLKRCQADKKEGVSARNMFVIGGAVGQWVRCSNRPTMISTESEPGMDGQIGKMAVCDECFTVMQKQVQGMTYERIEAVMPSVRARKPRKTFAEIAAGYKRYDPETEGYGSVGEWRDAFHTRMGWEEAERVIAGQGNSPREILGVSGSATFAEIKAVYRKLVLRYHPDRFASTGVDAALAESTMKRVNAAFVVLEREHSRK